MVIIPFIFNESNLHDPKTTMIFINCRTRCKGEMKIYNDDWVLTSCFVNVDLLIDGTKSALAPLLLLTFCCKIEKFAKICRLF